VTRRGRLRRLGGRSRRRAERCRSRGCLPLPGRDAAAAELAGALTASTRAYRSRLSVDLVLIDTLLSMGAASTAVIAVEEERQALQGFAEGLHQALASATGEDRAAG
jgi:hypothetical protein